MQSLGNKNDFRKNHSTKRIMKILVSGNGIAVIAQQDDKGLNVGLIIGKRTTPVIEALCPVQIEHIKSLL